MATPVAPAAVGGASSDAVSALEARLAKLEAMAEPGNIQSNCDLDETEGRRQMVAFLREKGAVGAHVVKVRPDYYDLTLKQRSEELLTTEYHLCKALIFENTACTHEEIEHAWNSRYVCVIVPYTYQLDTEMLMTAIRLLKPKGEAPVKVRMHMANEEVGLSLAGYKHNAVCPFGMRTQIPILISNNLAELTPQYLYLGGGDVDVKLRLPWSEAVRMGAIPADVAKPREQASDGSFV